MWHDGLFHGWHYAGYADDYYDNETRATSSDSHDEGKRVRSESRLIRMPLLSVAL